MKKIIFVIRSTGHFTYYQTIIDCLLNQKSNVYLFFTEPWSNSMQLRDIKKLYRREKRIKIEWAFTRKGFLRKFVFTSREIRSYRRYLLIKNQSLYYRERWRKYLPFFLPFILKLALFNNLLRSDFAGIILERVENLVPVDKKIYSYLLSLSPDVVIAGPANLRFSEEIEFIKTAKKMGIPTVVPVISWDNLTTKGLIQIIPDLLLVWNKKQVEEARKHHNIPLKNIKITGSPFFDKWFQDLKPSVDRTLFCKNLGLGSDNPILVYLGSSGNIASDETWLIQEIRQSLNLIKDTYLNKTQLIVRPHPANAKIYQKMQKTGIIIYPKCGTLPSTMDELQIFYDTLYYANAIVGINTSAMIDAVILDKPIIAIMSEKYRKTQEETQHFQQLLKNNVMELAYSQDQFLKKFLYILDGKDRLRKNRKKFISQFIRPLGFKHPAGEIAAKEIINLNLN